MYQQLWVKHYYRGLYEHRHSSDFFFSGGVGRKQGELQRRGQFSWILKDEQELA